MKLLVRNIDFIYDNDGNIVNVSVRYDSTRIEDFTLSGNVRITHEEYIANASDVELLQALVLEKVKLKINA